VAQIAVTLTSIEIDGKSYDVETSTFSSSGNNHNKRNLAYIGGGTLIGGLAGSGKGALIGSAIGAGAGTAGAAATGKKDVVIPAETTLSFRLIKPLTVSVKS
jgi:outer membrane lipoprotein SlyB